MQVDLGGRSALVMGRQGAVKAALAAAIGNNGARVACRGPGEAGDAPPDILVVVHELAADGQAADLDDLLAATDAMAPAMAQRGGRVIIVTTAFGLLPARRHPAQSVAAARTVAAMRGLAMQCGPGLLVNAVGAGAIADGAGGFIAGGAEMLDHVPNGAAGTIDDLVAAVLFLADPMNTYLTGQVLSVDGGWGAGYGRNF